ncbi:MAG: 16S rRNA (adenine(1518)-N(6)/adenine(1519)-N(6))-dimethyltransferase RsmA, partial [candidate division Zixibacteria bacterium]|nr:16S rRNA (adenine(1518)-N(6)/adenine(1519)-N(6))-dimethyltransferase RsmA [candidate division Zixibacteria bacterium]
MSSRKAQKRFSQNFLVNKNTAAKIVGFLSIAASDTIFEIGSGRGILTELMALTGARVFSFEIDRDLIGSLSRRLANYKNVQIVNRDFLSVVPWEYYEGSFKLIGNIPYDITSPILEWMMQYRSSINRVVITAQQELAERIASGPGSRHWAPLSIFCQCFFDVKKVMALPPKSFSPVPKIMSETLLFKPREKFRIDDWTYFEKIVRLSFRQRRKLLINNLALLEGQKRESILGLLLKLGLDEKIRAEQICIEDFIRLADELKG